MSALKKIGKAASAVLLVMFASLQGAIASEIDLNIPMLNVPYNIFGIETDGAQILSYAYLFVYSACFLVFMSFLE